MFEGRCSRFWACTRGNLDTVLLLLSKDENGRPLAEINRQDTKGATPVTIAIQFLSSKAEEVPPTFDRQIKGTEMVMLLTHLGADLSIPDKNGCLPMHWAAYKGDRLCFSSNFFPNLF